MSAPPEISIAFQTNKTPSEYRELAQLVNGYDVDAVSVYGDVPFQPSFGPLMLMAPHLDRARLGPACIAPSRMPPVDMAGNIALLDHLTQGRAYLGISRGAWLERHGVRELAPAIGAIRDSIEIVTRLLCGEGGYSGSVFQIDPNVRLPYPVYRQRIPILVGTWGPKLAAVAGELADEVKIGGCANPAMIHVMQEWIAEGERHAGRPVGSVGVALGAVTVVDEDSRAAKNTVKRELALYLPVVAGLDRTLQIDPELLARIARLVDEHQNEQAAGLISDDLLARFAFAGSPEDIIAQSEAIFTAGARRIEFGTPHGIQPPHGIRLLGEQVIPELKKR